VLMTSVILLRLSVMLGMRLNSSVNLTTVHIIIKTFMERA